MTANGTTVPGLAIAVFGAAGAAGSRIVTEALRRGHRVTAVERGTADAGDPAAVADVARGHDLVISAVRPPPGQEEQHGPMIRGLLDGTAAAGVRLVVVGGAGSLLVPDADGRIALDDERWVPAAWRPIAGGSVLQLEECRRHPDADWTLLSPPAEFAPGTRTGAYRLGRDTLLVDDRGRSSISMEDYAIALLDEVERPRHRRARFTVGGSSGA